MEPLLLVEDKNELRAMLRKALERAGYAVDEAPDGTTAIQKVRARRYLMVITDLKMPGASGLDVLRESKAADATIPVLLLTAFGSVEEAVSAMKEGAFDFLQKPVDLDHLKLLVQRATRQQEMQRENLLLREEYTARYGFPRIVGEHAAIREISTQIQKVAATDSTVLLLGESGTGKELFARAVHHLSPRREQPFVALNCAAIPEGLVENELFGHERGAFTGAGARKVGKLDLAHRGTLFLDEIGELPLAIQAKLLRVLEEKKFDRVGGTQTVEVDVRIVVATNRNLQKLAEEKLFPRGFVFPDFGRTDDDSRAARARERCASVGGVFLGEIQPRIQEAGTGAFRRSARTIAGVPLAGECARVAEHPGARGDFDGRPEHYGRRAAASRHEAGRQPIAGRDVAGAI